MTGFTLFRIGSVLVRFCDGWSEITIPTLPMLSIPWTEKPEDRALAERLGYDDPVLMNRDHDVVHLLIAHWLGRGVAPALSYAAGLRPAHPGWRLEEDAVLSMQAWMQASGTSLEELLRPYRVAEPAAPIGVGGAAPRAPADAVDDLFGKVPLVVRPLSATKGADWALCLDAPGEIIIAVSPGVAGFTRYVERDRRRFEALAAVMQPPAVPTDSRIVTMTISYDLDAPEIGTLHVQAPKGAKPFEVIRRGMIVLRAERDALRNCPAHKDEPYDFADGMDDAAVELVKHLNGRVADLMAERDLLLYGVYYADFAAVGIRHPNDGIRTCTGLNLEALAAAKRLRARGLVTIEDSPAGPMVAWVEGRGRAVTRDLNQQGDAGR